LITTFQCDVCLQIANLTATRNVQSLCRRTVKATQDVQTFSFVSLTAALFQPAFLPPQTNFYRQEAQSITCRYCFYSQADFWVFHPAEATRCTDQGEIWQGGADRFRGGFNAPKLIKNFFTLIGSGVWVYGLCIVL